MWIIIILAIVVVIILAKFFSDKNRQADKIAKEGGMRRKYKTLVEHFLSGDTRAQVFRETSDSITVGLSNMGGTTLFVLTQTFGQITVQWKIDSPIFGKHKLEWDFPEYGDQHQMIERISNDLLKYQQNMMSNFGL